MSDERGSGPENPERGMIARTGETGQHEDEALDLVEVAGRIKWFDVSKGFGFIVPDDGAPDILLHVTCLRRDGYQLVYTFDTQADRTGITSLLDALRRENIEFSDLSTTQSSLEQIFVQLLEEA